MEWSVPGEKMQTTVHKRHNDQSDGAKRLRELHSIIDGVA